MQKKEFEILKKSGHLCKITVKVHERNVNSCISKILKFHPSSFYQLITNSVGSIEKNTLPHSFNRISIIICYFEFWATDIDLFSVHSKLNIITDVYLFIIFSLLVECQKNQNSSGRTRYQILICSKDSAGMTRRIISLGFSSVSKVRLIYYLL